MSAHAILDSHPADFAIGFELGRDHARFQVAPPASQLSASSPVYQGFRAGQAAFGARTRSVTRHVQRWLQLRLDAWLRGQAFEDLLVTPNHLAQIDVGHCPVTRSRLTQGAGQPSDAVVERLRSDAAFAAGNLAMTSLQAGRAKASCTPAEAMARACRIEVGQLDTIDGLGAAEWARLATLMSFVTELPHEQALKLPLVVLPPNRLRLLNPIQALQALLTLQLARPGYSARIARIEQMVPGHAARHDLRRFFLALLPRVLEAGERDEQGLRWALEDAWRDPLVNTCWQRLARQLSASQAEDLVARITAQRDLAPAIALLSREQATDGWALESAGRVALASERAGTAWRRPRPAHESDAAPRRPAEQAALDLVMH
jgi:hypothetical protein